MNTVYRLMAAHGFRPYIPLILLLVGLLLPTAVSSADEPGGADTQEKPAASPRPISVATDRPDQTIDGFGASLAWYADNLARLTPETRDELFDFFFADGGEGLGLEILRLRISPEFSAEGEPYDWSHPEMQDEGRVVSHLCSTYDLRVMAVPWTAPRWMKDSGLNEKSGTLLPEHYDAYAAYLADWVEGMKEHFGVEVTILSVQNEPGKKPWEAMEWTTEALATFTREHLIPTLDRRGLELELMLNEETSWRPELMLDGLLADPVLADRIAIAAAHAYHGSFKNPQPIDSARDLGKRVWMTEHYLGDYALTSIENPMRRDLAYGQIMDRFFDEALIDAHLFWWAVGLPKNIPGALVALDVAADRIDTFERQKVAFVYGHFSRFVHPGWRRVPTAVPDTGDPDFHGLAATAFTGPDGRLSVVLINSSDRDEAVRLQLPAEAAGFSAEGWRAWITDDRRDLAAVETVIDPASIELPALSIVTVTGTPAAADD
ncbi:MAG: glycoside hydrolase family 30 beta sandwich domain-containing protein [Planctomycetota bacterium]